MISWFDVITAGSCLFFFVVQTWVNRNLRKTNESIYQIMQAYEVRLTKVEKTPPN